MDVHTRLTSLIRTSASAARNRLVVTESWYGLPIYDLISVPECQVITRALARSCGLEYAENETRDTLGSLDVSTHDGRSKRRRQDRACRQDGLNRG